MSTQFRNTFRATPRYIINAGTSGFDNASQKLFELMKTSAGTSDQLKIRINGFAGARIASGCRNTESQGKANVTNVASVTPTITESQIDEPRMTRLCRSIPAPCARETRTPTEVSIPMPKTKATLMREFTKAAAARDVVPTCPTMSVSTRPINICPTCPAIIGQASTSVLTSSVVKRLESGINRSPNQDFSRWQVPEGAGWLLLRIHPAFAFEQRRFHIRG